ncbi:EAL domain-containing protein [Methyloglobulus morosus KoM1]|uniref:EAL domain-containing protein n=1 Tax=Methyloglobulus morosus KoM1 TaxID=1116472 RepID=V5DMQ7_9GAMM|nr:GGDEF domain-containing phosphodiesterase [Methyloglobulus morosus]ESS68711.1 EAL domain-containing protein [Methyloglobulus morosus KoM1]
MNLLSRPLFIQTIGQISSSNDPHHTLIYTEINQVPKIASLLQGIPAEEKLIRAIQRVIYDRVKSLPDARMGKLGWNRFAIILKLPIKESLAVAEDLAQLLDNQSVDIDGVSYYPKLIFGVTPLSPEYKTPERILAAVDEALFQARRTGNSVVKLIEHDDPILQAYYDSLNLLPLITEGLKIQSFVLFAQPIVPITQQVTDEQKFEVLLRFKNEEGDIDPKSRFLETAELFHISREIDYYVVHQFCRFYAQAHQANTMYSLNISGSTIRYSPFIDVLEKEFKQFGVNPRQICFEITETVADRDYKQAIDFMNVLKNQLGCQLSLDDIGIGSSNLANLSKFNVDFLKIDGSFIKDVLVNPYSELVVNFITSAAKLYGRKTIAEYVENAQQLEKLRDLGVDFAQGYFTGKPEILFDPMWD